MLGHDDIGHDPTAILGAVEVKVAEQYRPRLILEQQWPPRRDGANDEEDGHIGRYLLLFPVDCRVSRSGGFGQGCPETTRDSRKPPGTTLPRNYTGQLDAIALVKKGSVPLFLSKASK